MTYTIMQLAPGSYDVLLDGKIIASLVRDLSCATDQWSAELLTEEDRLPEPFLNVQHRFQTFREVMIWLNDPEVISTSHDCLALARSVSSSRTTE